MEEALAPLGVTLPRWRNATNGLIAINVAVFLAMVASGVSWIDPTSQDLLPWGAEYGPLTLSGQYWRLITAAFVHIGIIHIALNMWCLWSLGRLLERLTRPVTTVGIYLVTAAGASLLSLSWDPMRVSAGASGAIFGIAGVLITVLYYGKLNLPQENIRKLLGYVVRFSLLNLLYGLRSNVNNMAHVGGLVTGLVAGLFIARSFSLPEDERSSQRRTVLIIAAAAVVLLFIPVARAKSYVLELPRGRLAYDQKDFKSAAEHLKKYTVGQPDDAYGHAFLGSALQGLERYDEAAREYEHALGLRPGYAFAQVNLGRVYLAQNRSKEAAQMFAAGISRVEPDSDNYYWYAVALKEAGDLDGAEKAARRSIDIDSKDVEAQFLLNEILAAKNANMKDAREKRKSASHAATSQSVSQ